MIAMAKISNKQEKQWQAEEDAHTMARYQEIMSDKTRMSRAIKVAKQQASDLEKRSQVMKKVAGVKNKK